SRASVDRGGNSGIFFHSKLEEGWPTAGYESQVNNTHLDPVKTGSLYYVVKVFESAAKDDEWWTQEILVQGKRITMKVNGKTLYEYVEPEGVSGPHKLSKGLFAFQQHDPGSRVRYKNVMVKPLP
ncbi:MAG: glycosyl hydrolase, partial [Planctomycetia bacterium 21-64-5]